MERLELNRVVLREDMDAMNYKVDQKLEALLALSKNNFQHAVTENVDPTSGFTVVNNPLYISSIQLDDPIQPQPAHNALSNKIPMVQGHLITQAGHIRLPRVTKNPKGVDPMINVITHHNTKAIQMCYVLGEQIRAL